MPYQSSVPVGDYIHQFINRTFDQIDYTGRDYFSFRDAMINFLRDNYPQYFLDFTDDDPLMMDIEALSYMGDVLSFYTDRVFNELDPIRARESKNMDVWTDFMNYRRRGYTSSIATGLINFQPLSSNKVLPAGYKVGFMDDELGRMVPFEVAESLLLIEGETTAQPILIQGETITEDFGVADGKVFFEKCTRPRYEEGSMKLFVNGELWNVVSTFKAQTPFSKVFRVMLDNSYTPYIESGDGNRGKLIPKGASVTAEYRISEGKRGDTPEGTITEFIDTYISEFTSVTNISEATGGQSALTVEELRSIIPSYTQVQERGVIYEDILELVINNPIHAVRTARVANDVVLGSTLRHVAVYVDNTGETPFEITHLSNLKLYLEGKVDTVYVINVYNPTFRALNVGLDITLADAKLSNEEMSYYFTNLISDYLQKDNWDFAAEINPSDIIAMIRSDARVENVKVRFFYLEGDSETTRDEITLSDLEILTGGVVDTRVTGGVE
jgi:hypothetical protein